MLLIQHPVLQIRIFCAHSHSPLFQQSSRTSAFLSPEQSTSKTQTPYIIVCDKTPDPETRKMRFPSFSFRTHKKAWFYSLDPKSRYFLSKLPESEVPVVTEDELRGLTGTRRVYWCDEKRRREAEAQQDESSRPSSSSSSSSSGSTSSSSSASTIRAPSLKSTTSGPSQDPFDNLHAQEMLYFTPPPSSIYSRNTAGISYQDLQSSNGSPPPPFSPGPASSIYSRNTAGMSYQNLPTPPLQRPSPPRNPTSHPRRPSSPPLSRPSPSASPAFFPRHPRHSRVFDARNLYCIVHTRPCALCAAPCCAYRGAMDSYDAVRKASTPTSSSSSANPVSAPHLSRAASVSEKDPQQQKQVLKTLIRAIRSAVTLPSRDESTFVRCGECVRWVCPACVGVCPVEGCADVVCKGCKPEMGTACEWHDGSECREGREEAKGKGRISGMTIDHPLFYRVSVERKNTASGTGSKFVPAEDGGEGRWVGVRFERGREVL